MEELKNSVFSRYGLHGVTIKHSALNFFSLADDPYRKALDHMLKISIQQSLRNDMVMIAGDFTKVYKKESALVDE